MEKETKENNEEGKGKRIKELQTEIFIPKPKQRLTWPQAGGILNKPEPPGPLCCAVEHITTLLCPCLGGLGPQA